VEFAKADRWSAEVELVTEGQAWSLEGDAALESTSVMFIELWLPFGPVSVELGEDSADLSVNTSVVESLQALDKSIGWSFTESTDVEEIESGLVVSGSLVQPGDELGSLLGLSGFKTSLVAGDLGVLVGNTSVELFGDLGDVSFGSGLPAVDAFSDSGLKSTDLSEETLFGFVDPGLSLGSELLSEGFDFGFSWFDSAEGLWKHTGDLFFESCISG